VTCPNSWLPASFGGALRNRCIKDGCQLALRDHAIPHLAVIDCDDASMPTGDERCDYLLLAADSGGLDVILLELKGGRLPAEKVASQLKAGARLADKLVGTRKIRNFFPVVLSGRRSRSSEYMSLLKPANRIRLRGRNKFPIRHRCGVHIDSVLYS
jgi:hypothetical protein